MVLYEVFSHAVVKHYKTSIVSKASLVQLICIVLTFLSPFLVAYFANGFWINESTYTEQPTIQFKYRYLAIFDTGDDFILSTTFENVNDIYQNHYRAGYREAQEVDIDGDSTNDYLKWTLEIPINSNEKIVNVKLLMIFNYTLTAKQNLQFESIGFLDTSNVNSGSQISFAGSLRLRQDEYVKNSGYNNVYAASPINLTNFNLEDLDLEPVLTAYYARPFATKLDVDYTTWRSSSNINSFTIKALIRYSKQQVVFIPGFWQQFKWGWIQYICVLLPFLYVFREIKIFIYENQLVPTVVLGPQKLKES